MAAGNNNYSIQLGAILNEKSIETQLKSIANKYSINLTVNVDSKGVDDIKKKVDQVQKSVIQNNRIGGKLIDANSTLMDLDKIQSRLAQIKKDADKNAKVNISTVPMADGTEKVTQAIYTYTDKTGKSIQERWVPALREVNGKVVETNQLVKSQATYIDNIAKAEKKAADETQKRKDTIDKMTLQADKFLEKSKFLSQSNPQVAKGIDVANLLKAELATNGLTDRARELSKQLSVVNEGVRTGGRNLQSWSTEIGIAIKRTIEWSLGIGLVYGALNQLKNGIQYVKELNKEMTNIQQLQVDGAKSNEEITKLAGSFNDLAKSLSLNTKEVAAGSVEWLRAGKSIAETQELLKATAMLSKLGNMDMATSTEYLTSMLNGYKLSASEAENVVSKLVAVDNLAATSSQELAAALQKTSNFAKISGVSIDELIGYVATVSSVTRKSAETIGTSFNFGSIRT
jgi:hypothetical protein